MTDIVIPFLMTEDDGLDLRYALRSIDTFLHLPDLQVTVVGEKRPLWLEPDLFIPVDRPYEHGVLNVAHGMQIASSVLSGEHIVYMEDDHLLLDHAETIPAVHYGLLDMHIANMARFHPKGHWWVECLRGTRRYLMGVENPLSWELHRPAMMRRGPWHAILTQMLRTESPVCHKTIYGNTVGWEASYPGRDGKGSQTGSFPAGVHWLSTHDGVLQSRGTSIKGILSTPSRWESA